MSRIKDIYITHENRYFQNQMIKFYQSRGGHFNSGR